jgi:aminopeptidase
MPLEAYADLVFAAARVDEADPVRAWAEQAARQEALRALLEGGRTLRFLADGTDLTLSVAGRRWRSSAANRNLPDGEVFSGPVEDSAEGTVRFSYPLVRAGRRIEDIRLRFERGVVVEAEAASGGEALRELLDVDAGARRLGEVGIGTNFGLDRFTGQILLDEKIGGTFHLALGRGYPETGSTNVSAEHWDLICDLRDGGEILLDGAQIQHDGRFAAGIGL